MQTIKKKRLKNSIIKNLVIEIFEVDLETLRVENGR